MAKLKIELRAPEEIASEMLDDTIEDLVTVVPDTIVDTTPSLLDLTISDPSRARTCGLRFRKA